MKTNLLPFLFLLILFGCNREKENPVDRVISNAIHASGGFERWESMKSIRYEKSYQLFTETGAIEQDVRQTHHYSFHPLSVEISSVENGVETITRLADNTYSRTVDGQEVEVEQATLRNSINASFFVFSFPFNLNDTVPERTYLGPVLLLDTLDTEAVRYMYPGSTDVWTFYTSTKNNRIIANLVNRTDHNSLVINDSFQEVAGLVFYKDRSSYRVDENGQVLYKRASYLYENFEVEW